MARSQLAELPALIIGRARAALSDPNSFMCLPGRRASLRCGLVLFTVSVTRFGKNPSMTTQKAVGNSAGRPIEFNWSLPKVEFWSWNEHVFTRRLTGLALRFP